MKLGSGDFYFIFLLIVAAMLGLSFRASAQRYTVPASSRGDTFLATGWRFIRQDVSGAQTNGFDDSTWTVVSLPHTWNNLDG